MPAATADAPAAGGARTLVSGSSFVRQRLRELAAADSIAAEEAERARAAAPLLAAVEAERTGITLSVVLAIVKALTSAA